MVTQRSTPPPPSRMTLGAVRKGKVQEPVSVLLYGVEGVGKSSFGAAAPAPIFLDGEGGTAELDVARFPVPTTWEDVREAVRVLANDAHNYRTFVVDTLDWIEPMLWEFICKRDGKKDIEDYGFGKGYVAALDEWRVFLRDLEVLRAKRGMNLVLLAHSVVRPFKNPEGDDYDRFEMKLHAKAAGLLKEWPKAVLFANWETFAQKDARTKRVKGISTGARLMFTTRTAAYDAKNRYGLPESMPLDWSAFHAAITSGGQEAEKLAAQITAKLADLEAGVRAKVADALRKAGSDVAELERIDNKVNTLLVEQKDGEK